MNGNNRNLLVIKASAGSGKTYNLALQYIRLLLFTTDGAGRVVPRRKAGMSGILNVHRQLLAITFTNKATDEMKERIVKELYNLSVTGQKSDYLETLMHESGLDESTLRTLAQQALHELLFDYSNFNVSTIDSFFQIILRNFARELDRDFNYDIQLEEKYAVRVALHKFLLSLGQKDKPTQVDLWVKEYMRHLSHSDDENRKWKFFDDGGALLDFAKQINTELFRTHMDEIRNYLGCIDQNGDFQSDFSRIRAFKKHVHQLVEGLEAEPQQVNEDLMKELATVVDALKSRCALKNALQAGAIKTDTLKGADEAKIASQFDTPVDTARVTRITQLVTRHFELKNLVAFFKSVEGKLGLLGMLAMIDVFLEQYRHETNSILIGDTNDLIGTVLQSGSDFVYERVGTTISHFMIDEFQDTSTKQYENFRGLLRESLANGNFNMLIGDSKQSIYRFRNADPAVFRDKVGQDFANDIYQPHVEPGKPQSVNFRSSPNIIEFNNLFYEFVSTCYPLVPAVAKTYQDVRQGMPPGINEKKVPGYVRILSGNYRQLLDDEFIMNVFLQEGRTVDPDQALSALDVLPAYLMQLHQRFDWGRIGILVNSNAHGNEVVERILEFNRTAPEPISIISGDSLLLNNSSVVRRIIALLRFIDINLFTAREDDEEADEDTPLDKVSQRMMRKRLNDQRLYAGLSRFIQAVSSHPGASPGEHGNLLNDCLADDNISIPDDGRSAAALLEQLLPSGDELSTLVSIVENIITYFKRDQLGQADVDREAAFLLAFQDTVLQFSSMRNGGSVREFLKFWDEKKDRLTVNASATTDAINIMTIHKAKGLEFDCVVIPFANWELNGNAQEHSYWMPGTAFVGVMDAMAPQAGECDPDILPPLLNVPKNVLVDAFEKGHLSGKARDFVEEQLTAVILDNLNKTYVAMTRPRTELHMFTDAGKKNDLKPLLQQFFDNNGDVKPIIGRDDAPTGWYEYGEISTRQAIDAKRTVEPVTACQVAMTRYPVTDIPLEVKVRLEHASSSSIDAGLRLHNVMSRIQDRDDVDAAIAMGLKHGVITDDPDDPCGIDVINANIRAAILDPRCRPSAWFDPANKVYSERTIFTDLDVTSREDDRVKNPRPDRIIRLPDGHILVIDYKSGRLKRSEHLKQLRGYIAHLQAIFPDSPVAGRLWYTTLNQILDEKGRPLPLTL